MPHHTRSSRSSSLETFAVVHPNAAGPYIGSSEVVAALPPDRSATPLRAFSTFTPDLHAFVDWLVEAQIQ